ncbi:MAG TPA: ligase-associated DNA damage response endonuclease PdeM [Flavitalea sp.]|nr:ligase-associated DNA damage response endonuclease PdeM [Flavitalea sp.]
MQITKHIVRSQEFCLNSERSIFWEKEKTLIVSDLHFGKTGHFRKAGIAVPQSVYKEDLQRLFNHITFFKAERLLVVGDLFHSKANLELEWFLRWRKDHEYLAVNLVQGNHDILDASWYKKSAIDVTKGSLNIGEFCFQHDPADCYPVETGETPYLFTGHIHPGVVISGLGKQSLRFPCFYFGQDHCVLPAFSRFTGAVSVNAKDADAVYAIVNQSIMRV